MASPDATPRRKRGFKAWHFAGILLLLSVGTLMGYAFWPEAGSESEAREPAEVERQQAAIDAAVLERVSFPLRVESTGHLEAWRRTEIASEAQGLVVKRLVEEGEYVNKGDVLLQLGEQDVAIELEEAEAAWLALYADYQILRGSNQTLGMDSTVLQAIWQAMQRVQAVDSVGGVPAASDIRNAIQEATLGLTQAEQRLQRARLALSRTRVVAPFSGRVADLEVEEGQRISPGQKVMTLLDDRRMKVDVNVLETNIIHLKKGATARIRIPSMGDGLIPGTIHSINPTIDPTTGTGRVTLAISNKTGRLMAGLFSYAYLEADRLADRLVLPAEAVLARQGRDLVFRVEEGSAQWVYVELGARSGDYVEIVDGLAAGDTIAVAGHFALAHDTPVTVENVVPAFTE